MFASRHQDLTQEGPPLEVAPERVALPLSPQPRWLRALGGGSALLLYALLAFAVWSSLTWPAGLTEAEARIAELEEQVVTVIRVPAVEQPDFDIGRINQGNPGDEGAAADVVDAPDPVEVEADVLEEATQAPEPEPAEPQAPPELAEPVALPLVSDESLIAADLPLFDSQVAEAAQPPSLEPLELSETQLALVSPDTAEAEPEPETAPGPPLVVPPSKPQRDVVLPQPVTRTPAPVARAQPAETRSRDDGRGQSRSSRDTEATGGGGHGGGGETNYLGRIAKQLNDAKVYPPESIAARETGVVAVTFTIDEEGWVIARRVVRSSGHRRLDDEVMDLLIRSSPLPKPPTGGEWLTLTVRIAFTD
ncbi:MAG: TonB family protein [Pseudomonadota bacterium]